MNSTTLSGQNATKLALVLALLMVILIWARTGVVPAASCGDEVWWSESGYWLAKDGVTKWEIMADDRGSATMSFWPPVLPVVQAFFIQVFGLNSFAICAQSSLHSTLLIFLLYLVSRQRGLAMAPAIFTAVGVLAVLSIQQRFVNVRMESATTLAVLAFMWLHTEAKVRSRPLFYCLAGFAVGVGVLTYYPLAPFLLGGVFLFLAMERDARAFGYTVVGGLPLALVTAAWIVPGWEDFRSQVLATGAEKYLNGSALIQYLVSQLSSGSVRGVPIALELFVMFALLVWKTLRHEVSDRGWLILAWFLLAPVAIVATPQLVGAFVCVWVLVFASPTKTQKTSMILGVTRICFALFAFAQFLLIGATALLQSEGRNYASVKKQLDKISLEPGSMVAISQTAWLGLRERAQPDQLHLLVYSGASLNNASRILRDSNAPKHFDLLILETNRLKVLSEVYPWIAQGLKTGAYREVKRIRPDFRALPWSAKPNYDLTVFEKAPEGPESPTHGSQNLQR